MAEADEYIAYDGQEGGPEPIDNNQDLQLVAGPPNNPELDGAAIIENDSCEELFTPDDDIDQIVTNDRSV